MPINVDAIYVLSMPHSFKRKEIEMELNRVGIPFEWVNSIADESGIKGLQETMCVVFKVAKYKGQKKILILEDDCVCEVDNPVDVINDCLSQLPEDFDILQLGANLVRPPEKYSYNLYTVTYSHATHASVYSEAGMEKVLRILDYKTHLDALIHNHIQKDKKCFVSFPMVFNQRDGYSEIERRFVKYGTMMRKKFNQYFNGTAHNSRPSFEKES